jgi:hypothetical protein
MFGRVMQHMDEEVFKVSLCGPPRPHPCCAVVVDVEGRLVGFVSAYDRSAITPGAIEVVIDSVYRLQIAIKEDFCGKRHGPF